MLTDTFEAAEINRQRVTELVAAIVEAIFMYRLFTFAARDHFSASLFFMLIYKRGLWGPH